MDPRKTELELKIAELQQTLERLQTELTSCGAQDDTFEDEDVSEETVYDVLDEEDIEEVTEMCREWLDDYCEKNVLSMMEPSFHEMMEEELADYLTVHFDGTLDTKYIVELAKDCAFEYFEDNDFLPARSSENITCHTSHDDMTRANCMHPISDVLKRKIESQIEWIRSVPQPAQGTQEWHDFRAKILTASNLWKALGSEKSVASLVAEKCSPPVVFSGARSCEWGKKFERVTADIYSDINKVEVEEFGCIVHKQYDYIGASPDGIVTDPTHPKFGRMLEIKNVVTREIDGIPKKEYWVQTQIQMEVCDLDECDFVETKFECCGEEEFEELGDDYRYKGAIVSYIGEGRQLKHVYSPLHCENVKEWIDTVNTSGYYGVEVCYWYMETFSCTLIKRNHAWFQAAIPKITEVWNTIQVTPKNTEPVAKKSMPFIIKIE